MLASAYTLGFFNEPKVSCTPGGYNNCTGCNAFCPWDASVRRELRRERWVEHEGCESSSRYSHRLPNKYDRHQSGVLGIPADLKSPDDVKSPDSDGHSEI